jgi:SapC protein
MAKQLLIYETAVPLSASRHGKMSLEQRSDFAFSNELNAVPLMAVEFIRAATEYAIVFAATGDDVLPAAVLGVRPNQNLYVGSNAKWEAKYIPAFIRRYPFVFAATGDRQMVTLCVDESHPGLNRDGKGRRLFDDDGKPSTFTNQVLTFLKEYQAHYERTRLFGQKLKEFDLLEPMTAQVTTPKGEKMALGGFMAVPRRKLRALSTDALASLAKTDELELLYLHLYSMRNFVDVKDRLIGTLSSDDVVAEPTEASRAGDTETPRAGDKVH